MKVEVQVLWESTVLTAQALATAPDTTRGWAKCTLNTGRGPVCGTSQDHSRAAPKAMGKAGAGRWPGTTQMLRLSGEKGTESNHQADPAGAHLPSLSSPLQLFCVPFSDGLLTSSLGSSLLSYLP